MGRTGTMATWCELAGTTRFTPAFTVATTRLPYRTSRRHCWMTASLVLTRPDEASAWLGIWLNISIGTSSSAAAAGSYQYTKSAMVPQVFWYRQPVFVGAGLPQIPKNSSEAWFACPHPASAAARRASGRIRVFTGSLLRAAAGRRHLAVHDARGDEDEQLGVVVLVGPRPEEPTQDGELGEEGDLGPVLGGGAGVDAADDGDRKSTRLNSSH